MLKASKCSHFMQKAKVPFISYKALQSLLPTLACSLSCLLLCSPDLLCCHLIPATQTSLLALELVGHFSISAPLFFFSLLRVIFPKFSWLPLHICFLALYSHVSCLVKSSLLFYLKSQNTYAFLSLFPYHLPLSNRHTFSIILFKI